MPGRGARLRTVKRVIPWAKALPACKNHLELSSRLKFASRWRPKEEAFKPIKKDKIDTAEGPSYCEPDRVRVMIVAAGVFVAVVGCSLVLIIRELRKAPEGYEDEHGFHTVGNGAVKYGVPGSIKTRRTRSSLNWAVRRTLRIKAFLVRGLLFFSKRVPHAASEFSATSQRRADSYR